MKIKVPCIKIQWKAPFDASSSCSTLWQFFSYWWRMKLLLLFFMCDLEDLNFKWWDITVQFIAPANHYHRRHIWLFMMHTYNGNFEIFPWKFVLRNKHEIDTKVKQLSWQKMYFWLWFSEACYAFIFLRRQMIHNVVD